MLRSGNPAGAYLDSLTSPWKKVYVSRIPRLSLGIAGRLQPLQTLLDQALNLLVGGGRAGAYLLAVDEQGVGDAPVEEGAYVRVGSTNRRASQELVEEMRRFRQGEAYDEQAMPALNSEEIDFRVASELFAPVRSLKRSDLETLRLITTHQGRKVPTVGGVLLFGRNRDCHFPDAWIQAGRFRGTDKTQIADHIDIRLHLPLAVDAAVDFVRKHTKHGIDIGAVRRTERWSLPPVAVREAIINALAHGDYAQRGAPIRISIYDDRLEVENPGLLPFGLTVDDLLRGISKLRNRVIGRVFHELGLVEQWGSGIQRIVTTCREAGLGDPTFEELGTSFRVTLPTDRRATPVVDVKDQSILDMLSRDEATGYRPGRSPSS